MKKILVLTLLIMVIVSCKTAENSSGSDSGDAGQDVNKSITLTAPTQINSFKANDFVGLVVQNNSDDQIALSSDYGVNIKMMSENQWLDVANFTTTFKSPVVLSPKNQKDLSFMLFDVIPKVEIQEPTIFRFTIMGMNQSTKQEVYGYIDLKLSP